MSREYRSGTAEDALIDDDPLARSARARDARVPLINQEDSDSDDGEAGQGEENLRAVGTPMTPFLRSPVMFFNERFKAGSIKGSIFTLVVAIVGAGTLSVPYAVQQSGLLLGIFLFGTGAALAFFSLQLLVISSELTGIKSYTGIAKELYGPKLAMVAQASLLLNLYGTSISYIVAAGSMISTVLQVIFDVDEADASYFLKRKFVMIMTTIVIIVPLSLLRTMGALRYSSLIAVGCSLYLTLIVTVKYFQFCAEGESVDGEKVQCFWEEPEQDQDPIELVVFNISSMVNCFSITVYCYTCHPNVLPIFLELKTPTRKRMVKVVGRAIGLAFLMYALLGTFGYLTFKSQLETSEGNFLNNDYHQDTMVLLGACGMSFSVLLAVPLFTNAFRSNIYRILAGAHADPLEASTLTHYAISLGFITAVLVPSIVITDISVVFRILGSTTNPIICFVLPTLFILRAAPSGSMYRFEKIAAVLCALVVCTLSVISLLISFR